MARTEKPLALVLDDDLDFIKIAAMQLQQLGMRVSASATEFEFLKKIANEKPDFCIIDLNIGGIEGGFALVRKIRTEVRFTAPVFIVSAISEAQSIAHAMEVGANDFIVKPLDREILASKLVGYFNLDELADHRLSYLPAPDGGFGASVTVEIGIVGIDELGINLTGTHLLTKGTLIKLSGALMGQLSTTNEPVLMRVVSTWVNDDGRSYGAYAEFDSANTSLLTAVRRWLTENAGRIGTQGEPS